MINRERIRVYARAFRVNQWIKNLVVFTAVIFSGKLFDGQIFGDALYAFAVFCLLSSTSYVLNDIMDYQYDRKHPVKKNRPIASGQISIAQATFIVFVFTLLSLILSILFSVYLFMVAFAFILLHFLYSMYLKKFPVIDIFSISFSFMLRTLAGVVATGFHVPIWLMLSIFFISLFIATIKRQSEFVAQGVKGTRESLYRYKAHLLDFLTYTFSTSIIMSYSFYTYFEKPPPTNSPFGEDFTRMFPDFEARKWLMITIPLVVYGIARYAQLLYEKAEGERPEKIITTDLPLIVTMFLWGAIVIGLIYIF